MNRVCIFIDGENFRKTISDLFKEDYKNHDYLPPNADWTKCLNMIIHESALSLGYDSDSSLHFVRAYWYVINELQYPSRFLEEDFDGWDLIHKYNYIKKAAKSVIGDPNMKDKDSIGKAVDRARRHLHTQHQKIQDRLRGWKERQKGIERSTPRVQFQRFGHIGVHLDKLQLKNEKGVDVKLATDLILLKDIYDIAILVSGDADYIPAVNAIKNYGKTVVAVDFLKPDGGTLPGGAEKLKHASDDCISLDYQNFKKNLGY